MKTGCANNSNCQRILGDASGEMGPFGEKTETAQGISTISSWYYSSFRFFKDSHPWRHRGGRWHGGKNTRIFTDTHETGGASSMIGFRLVLTP